MLKEFSRGMLKPAKWGEESESVNVKHWGKNENRARASVLILFAPDRKESDLLKCLSNYLWKVWRSWIGKHHLNQRPQKLIKLEGGRKVRVLLIEKAQASQNKELQVAAESRSGTAVVIPPNRMGIRQTTLYWETECHRSPQTPPTGSLVRERQQNPVKKNGRGHTVLGSWKGG